MPGPQLKNAIRIVFAFFTILCCSVSPLFAQYKLTCIIKDRLTKENLPAVTATIAGSKRSVVSDSSGKIIFTNLPAGMINISFSFVGYETETPVLQIPQTTTAEIFLKRKEEKEAEVIVSSSRTNSRIEDLPTKVEVIGSEEMDEEATTIPGNIARLLGDVAGIQNHLSSATTGNADMRIQGLPGKYTQILRDGLPLFGGYSGSFSILQIPPLDLKQAEIIKGSSSTLYGGGAIAGMINLISKTPQLLHPEHIVLVNHSTSNETNANAYFAGRKNKAGYTLFAGTTLQRAKDFNNDGFSDVPDLKSYFFHPRLFLYPDKKNSFSVGYNFTYEDRNGGDMQVLHKTADSLHRFFIKNRSFRNTLDAGWENKLNITDRLNLKATVSFYDRNIETNTFGMKAGQQSFFTEFSYLKKAGRHVLVTGLNFSGENFEKKQPDSSAISNYHTRIAGAFIQDDWRLTPAFTAQTGLRLDYYNAKELFTLPRLSLLYKINKNFTSRLGGGLGYNTASVFNSEEDERALQRIALSPLIKPERSKGLNWDINYSQHLDELSVTVNQMFFITQVDHPLIIDSSSVTHYLVNAGQPVNTKGFETYVQVKYDELEIYLGYAYTMAKQLYNTIQPFVPLSARSKFACVISNEFSSRFRACLEASYTGRQYLDDRSKTPGYFITNAMIRYDIKKISFVLNCENLFDYRQTKKENIVLPPTTNPSFKQVWAPLDGRVINLSVKLSW